MNMYPIRQRVIKREAASGELAAGIFQSIPEEARITSSPAHYSLPPIIITHVSASCIQEKQFFSQFVILWTNLIPLHIVTLC